jgi:hypothetical protein
VQLIHKILTNILEPPTLSAWTYTILKRQQEEKVEELQLAWAKLS